MAAPVVAQAPVLATAPTRISKPLPELTDAVFVPAQPVRIVAADPAPAATAPVAPKPSEPETQLAVVTARSANVRSGPSTADEVIGRLAAGEQVLIVVQQDALDGWSLVRIEGDGVSGYVATRLLQPLD